MHIRTLGGLAIMLSAALAAAMLMAMESLLKSRRLARGMTVRAAAKELGVTPGTYLRWEAGGMDLADLVSAHAHAGLGNEMAAGDDLPRGAGDPRTRGGGGHAGHIAGRMLAHFWSLSTASNPTPNSFSTRARLLGLGISPASQRR